MRGPRASPIRGGRWLWVFVAVIVCVGVAVVVGVVVPEQRAVVAGERVQWAVQVPHVPATKDFDDRRLLFAGSGGGDPRELVVLDRRHGEVRQEEAIEYPSDVARLVPGGC